MQRPPESTTDLDDEKRCPDRLMGVYVNIPTAAPGDGKYEGGIRASRTQRTGWRWYDWLGVTGIGCAGIGFIAGFVPKDGIALLFPIGLAMMALSGVAARKFG